jgi:hypothetical protein
MTFLDALLLWNEPPSGKDGAMDITYIGVGLAAVLILLQILVSVR